MRVSELTEHILVGWCDLRDHDFGVYYPGRNVLQNDSRSINLARMICVQFVGFYHWFDYIRVKGLIGIRELHYDKSGSWLGTHGSVLELDSVCPPRE